MTDCIPALHCQLKYHYIRHVEFFLSLPYATLQQESNAIIE